MEAMDLNVKAQHPKGRIQLLDGRVLDCYQSKQIGKADNMMKLDTTGDYFSVKKPQHVAIKAKDGEAKMNEQKLFTDNAFLFLDKRERILSDSRMFLCPIPIQSGIAYTGTGGFNRPTLGIYLEWWKYCSAASILEENDEEWLVYHIAGSPLSGCNRCGLVNPFGETKTKAVSSFISLWARFMEINCRYDEAKEQYEAFTLRKVLSILENEGCVAGHRQAKHIPFLEQVNYGLMERIDYLNTCVNKMRDRMHQALIKSKEKELTDFKADYREHKEAKDKRLTEIQAIRTKLHKQLKEGKIDNIQYQREWMPLHKEKDSLTYEFNKFVDDKLRLLFPDERISLYEEVKDFLEK